MTNAKFNSATSNRESFCKFLEYFHGQPETVYAVFNFNGRMYGFSEPVCLIPRKRSLFHSRKEGRPVLGNLFEGKIVGVRFDPDDPRNARLEGNRRKRH